VPNVAASCNRPAVDYVAIPKDEIHILRRLLRNASGLKDKSTIYQFTAAGLLSYIVYVNGSQISNFEKPYSLVHEYPSGFPGCS
jgi:hypothetical protein